jgi:hypothetical protein
MINDFQERDVSVQSGQRFRFCSQESYPQKFLSLIIRYQFINDFIFKTFSYVHFVTYLNNDDKV